MKTKTRKQPKGKPATRSRHKRPHHTPSLNLQPSRSDVAGADIGAREIALCVPEKADREPVRIVPTFTADLKEAVAWLQRCKVSSVAMESTGLYWLPFAQMLGEAGIEVVLVNAHHVRHLPGRKSDVLDCQWLQYLHSVGLLRGSFRPDDQLCALRSLTRHRDSLVEQCATQVRHVQAALTQMNIQLHHVIDDITGVTGSSIVEAILAGERDPETLARCRNGRIKASRETIIKSLQGDWRQEHLLVLRLAWESRAHFQNHIAIIEEEIFRRTAALESATQPSASTPAPSGKKPAKKQRQSKNQPVRHKELREHYTRILGVDLTQIPSVNVLTVQALLSEIGPDFSAFPSQHHLASWSGLCPGTKISGGRRLSSRSRRGKPRIAVALRQSVSSLHSSDSALGARYRRLRTKLGAPKAITAMAHLILKIIYKLVNERIEYDDSIFAAMERRHEQNRFNHLQRMARKLGYTLITTENPTPSE